MMFLEINRNRMLQPANYQLPINENLREQLNNG